MRFQHIIEQVYTRPWQITPEGHASIRALLESKLAEQTHTNPHPEAMQSGLADMEDEDLTRGFGFDLWVNPRQSLRIVDGIAYVHCLGPLGKNLSAMERACGATGYERLQRDFDNAREQGAKAVVFMVDSPGGSVMGLAELTRYLLSYDLPTVGFCDTLACSAAYRLIAACDYIVASESAAMGNIGTIIPWVDREGMMEMVGLKSNPIVNTEGRYKGIGFYDKLSDDHRAHLQSMVDTETDAFKADVRVKRPDVPDAAMQGQWVTGDEALMSGLIDEIGDMQSAVRKAVELASA